MPQPYSADLRERVLVAYEQGEGTSGGYCPPLSRVPGHRLQLDPPSPPGRPAQPQAAPRRTCRAAGSPELALLQALVAETNDARLDEYAERLFALTGKRVSRPVMCRTLQRLKLRRKKRRSGRPSRIGPRSLPSVRLTVSR